MQNRSLTDERVADLERRVMRLEQQVELLLGRQGFGAAASRAPDTSEVEQLLRRGNKIEAIKVYREKTGVGLKEAKDAVEEIERRIR
jgi:ribosomal protein L7/L12